MTANQNIPALRFPDFEGEWEKHTLEGVTSHFKSGQGITAKQIEESGTYPVFGGNGLRGYTETYTHDGDFVLIGRQGALCGNINKAFGRSYISEHAIAVSGNIFADTTWLFYKLDLMNPCLGSWPTNHNPHSISKPWLRWQPSLRWLPTPMFIFHEPIPHPMPWFVTHEP
jgi:hypothetical protein